MRQDDYHIPEEDGAVLIVPAFPGLAEQVQRNRAALALVEIEVSGRKFSELRTQARQAVLEVALSLPAQTPGEGTDPLLVMTGHQPVFPHPGIWLKNHLACALAREVDGFSVNMVVDSDAPGPRSFQLPEVADGQVSKRELAFLEEVPGLAYEEYRVGKGADFTSALGAAEDETLDHRLRASLSEFARRLSPEEGAGYPTTVTKFRQTYEEEFGVENVEFLLSDLTETAPFRYFLLHILAKLEPFRAAYNAALETYRELHGIRSPANPLPNLEPGETPFWVWPAGQPRRPLFVESRDGSIALLYEQSCVGEIPWDETAGLEASLSALQALAESGLRIRSRALVTTMFCRLFVADIFIHGIGGAKYDVVTDEIIETFFGFKPPVYIAATGTFYLPVDAVVAGARDLSRLRYQARDVDYNPFRYAPESVLSSAAFGELASEKKSILNGMPQKGKADRYAGFVRVKEINRQMAALIPDGASSVRERLRAALSLTNQRAILEDRSYPFFLFPQAVLREALSSAGIAT